MTHIDGSFETNQSHTNRLGEEKERQKAVLANYGVEESLVDRHKCLQNVDNCLGVNVVENRRRVVHIVENLV